MADDAIIRQLQRIYNCSKMIREVQEDHDNQLNAARDRVETMARRIEVMARRLRRIERELIETATVDTRPRPETNIKKALEEIEALFE